VRSSERAAWDGIRFWRALPVQGAGRDASVRALFTRRHPASGYVQVWAGCKRSCSAPRLSATPVLTVTTLAWEARAATADMQTGNPAACTCAQLHPRSRPGLPQGMNDLVTPFLAIFLSEHLPGRMEDWEASKLSPVRAAEHAATGKPSAQGRACAGHAAVTTRPAHADWSSGCRGRLLLVPLQARRGHPGSLHLRAARHPAGRLPHKGACAVSPQAELLRLSQSSQDCSSLTCTLVRAHAGCATPPCWGAWKLRGWTSCSSRCAGSTAC
jgi:hypothetical protein